MQVATLLGIQPLEDDQALEHTVNARRSPRILHLATHGFFLLDQAHDPNAMPLAAQPFLADVDRFPRLSRLEHPLLRSGLTLAGANSWA